MASPYDVSDDILLRAFGLHMNRAGSMIKVLEQKPRREDFEPRERDDSQLGKLPLEVFHFILRHMDIQSLDALRLTCFTSYERIQCFSPYKEIMRYSPDTLRVFKEAGLSSQVTAREVQSVLRSDRCERCNSYGPFLFLFNCQRCCLCCISLFMVNRFTVMDHTKATALMRCISQKLSNPNQGLEEKLLVMKTIPGKYRRFTSPSSFGLVSWLQVKRLITESLKTPGWKTGNDISLLIDWKYDKISLLRRIRKEFGLGSLWAPSLWDAVVPFPSIDPTSKAMEQGLLCGACDEWYYCLEFHATRRSKRFYRKNGSTNNNRVSMTAIQVSQTHYTKTELLQHFKECKHVQSIRDGTIVSRFEHRFTRELFSALPLHNDWPEPDVSYDTELFDCLSE